MLERVCNGRRTRVFTLKALSSARMPTTSTAVQRVSGEKLLRHKRIVANTKLGSHTSSARKSTRCSKFNLKECERLAPAEGEVGSEAILLDSTVEASAAEPEGLCSMADVASMARKRLSDQERFYFFQTHLFERPGPIPRLQRKI